MTTWSPDETLVDLAGSVSDRDAVDWQQAAASGRVQGIDGLRTLERIAATFEEEEACEESRADRQTPLFSWAHLQVLESIGEGRFGRVYRAHDPQLGRDVALKLTLEDQKPLPRQGLAEARRLARIRHPNVLTVYGAAVHDGRVGIWCELLRGQTLDDRLGRDGTFSEGELRLVGTELCRALSAVHGAGLVHGDVKPGNVVRDPEGKWVLVDFGASRPSSAPPAAVVQATPSYLAPEVAKGDEPPTQSSDLYALGALLYRLATDEFWCGEQARPLRDVRPDLALSLVQAIESLLAPSPETRPASAGESERLLVGERDSMPAAAAMVTRRRWTALTWANLRPPGLVWITALFFVALVVFWISRLPERRLSEEADEIGPAVLWAERGGESFAVSENDSLRPGDRLNVQLDLAAESHVYVFNEDEKGELFVLFPLPGLAPQNPVPAGRHRLPGTLDGRSQSWEVTSAGGRERFLIVGSASKVAELELFRNAHELARMDARSSRSMAPVRIRRSYAGSEASANQGLPTAGSPTTRCWLAFATISYARAGTACGLDSGSSKTPEEIG